MTARAKTVPAPETEQGFKEQLATEQRRAAQVASYVEILDVELRQIVADIHVPLEELANDPSGMKLHPAFTATYRFDEGRRQIAVTAKYLAVLNRSERMQDGPAVFTCHCEFEARYLFGAEGGPTGAEQADFFGAFARLNGIFNTWPYFRELVQATAGRMGIPGLVVPVYRIASVANQRRDTVRPSEVVPTQKEAAKKKKPRNQ